MSLKCQSCGMPMKKDIDFGSNTDKTTSTKYCSHCFVEGKFVDENITFDQMKAKVLGKMNEMHVPKFLAKMFTKNMHELERWNKK